MKADVLTVAPSFFSILHKFSTMNQKEIWKDIPGYKGIYQASSLGRIKSLKFNKEKILKKHLNINNGYLQVKLCYGKPKLYRVHKLILMTFINYKCLSSKISIDHIDFNRENNELSNLRVITQRENSNQKHLKSSSQFIGVSWHNQNNKWRAAIYADGKSKHIGYFVTELEASVAYKNELKLITTNEKAYNTHFFA